MSGRPRRDDNRRSRWARWTVLGLGLALAAAEFAPLRRRPAGPANSASPAPIAPPATVAPRSTPPSAVASPATRPSDPTTDPSDPSRPPRRTPRRTPRHRTAVTAAALLAVIVLVAALSVRLSVGPHDSGSEPVRAASQTTTATGAVERYPDLGSRWPRVRETMDQAVASAALQGFRLSMCLNALDTTRGESYCAGDAREEHYAASSIKIAIAVAVLERDLDNRDEVVQVLPSDIRDGSGTIKYLGPGPYPLGELVRLMIVASDNSATVTLLRRLGSVAAANAPTLRMADPPAFTVGNFGQALGPAPDTGSLSAAGAAAYLTELLRCADGDDCSLTTREVAEVVVGHMRGQQIVTKVGLYLEPGSFGSKAGDVDLVSHDVAFADTERGRIVLTAASTAADPAYPDPIIALAARDVVAAIDAG